MPSLSNSATCTWELDCSSFIFFVFLVIQSSSEFQLTREDEGVKDRAGIHVHDIIDAGKVKLKERDCMNRHL